MKHSVQAPGYPGAAHTSGKHRLEHDTPIAFAAAPVGVIVFAQRLTVHAHVLLQAAVPAGHWHMRTKCANRGDRNSEIRSSGFCLPANQSTVKVTVVVADVFAESLPVPVTVNV
jgi:hypothetical protein